jgi:hypothetical protein
MEELGGRFSGITHGDQVHVASSNEVCVGIGVFVNAYGQNNEIRLVAMQLEKGRQFHQARLAPCRPKVQQHNLPAIIRQMDGGGSVGDCEIGCGLIGLCWMGAAVAGGRKGQREDYKIGERTREPHILIIRSDRPETKA